MGKQSKQFNIEILDKRKNGGEIVISTPEPDRDRDRVFPGGMRAENYLKNPVVQWGHNYVDPWATVGNASKLSIVDKGVLANFELRPAANEHDPQNVVLLLWEGEWVKASSIGFIPLEFDSNELGGRDFTAWELLEFSLVPIPANQSALRLAYAAKTGQAEIKNITDILKAGDLSPEAIARVLGDDDKRTIAFGVTNSAGNTSTTVEQLELLTEDSLTLLVDDPPMEGIDKGQADAPNYREASGSERCGNCRFLEGAACTRFDFNPDLDFTCDDYEPRQEEMSHEESETDEVLICLECAKRTKGRSLASALNDSIDGMVTDDRSRSDIIADMASEAGISAGTVNQILNGDINCPPIDRLRGFARVLDISLARIVSAAESDGCEYGSDENTIADVSTKAGRVLSAKNEDRIKQARDLLDEILSSLPDDDNDDNEEKNLNWDQIADTVMELATDLSAEIIEDLLKE